MNRTATHRRISFLLNFNLSLKSILFIITFVVGENILAHTPQEGKVTATIAPYIYKTDFKDTRNGVTSPYFGGLGLIVEGDSNDRGGLEIGVFHMNKQYIRERLKKYISTRTQVMHVTMGYRWWLGQYLSFSPSFFSSHSMGARRVVHNEFARGTEPNTSAEDYVEYGFDFSTQAEVWSQDKYSVVVDARYSRSVTSKDHEAGNHYGVMVGLKYVVQEKEEPKKEPVEPPPP